MSDQDIIELRDDLQSQADMFDMEIDWETLNLVKRKVAFSKTPWLDKWLDQQSESDYMPDGSDKQEYDDER